MPEAVGRAPAPGGRGSWGEGPSPSNRTEPFVSVTGASALGGGAAAGEWDIRNGYSPVSFHLCNLHFNDNGVNPGLKKLL